MADRADANRNPSKALMPQRVSLGWSPFHMAAIDYLEAGFLPIPLPEGKKYPPPYGIPNDIEIDSNQVNEWLVGTYTDKSDNKHTDNRNKNIGCVIPDGVVVFDIDGPSGRETLIELENQLGSLPATWFTFRGDPE